MECEPWTMTKCIKCAGKVRDIAIDTRFGYKWGELFEKSAKKVLNE